MIKNLYVTMLISVFGLANSSYSQEVSTPTLGELREQADAALGLPNVPARKEIGVVFELVDRLIQENQSNDAMKYIESGLAHYPWNLKYQMIYAELLAEKGDQAEASEKAELVFTYAETEDLIEQARKLLNKESPPKISKATAIPGTNYCVVLVPMLECENWLVRRLGEELSSTLSIPVYSQQIEMTPPSYSRDQLDRTLKRMRKQFIAGLDDPELNTAMAALELSGDDLDSDDNVIALMKHLLGGSGADATKQFEDFLAESTGKDPQWDAAQLRATLAKAIKPYRRDNIAYLGVTSVDIYSDGCNFLFGSANSFGGVISYHRFTADFNNEVPNQERLTQRALMQSLSSIGHIYGVKRCSSPTCARAYPNSLAEHDAKTGELCPACRNGFNKKFEPVN